VEAGTVGRRRDGSGDGDVREGGEVVEGEAARINDGGEVAIANSGADGDGFGGNVEVDGVEGVEGDLILGAVGDCVEGMTRAERAEVTTLADGGLDLFSGVRLQEVRSGVGVVAGPVRAGRGLCLSGKHPRQDTAGESCARGFEKFALIHGEEHPAAVVIRATLHV